MYRALKRVVSVGRIHHKHTVARHIGELRSNRQRNNRQTRKREELRIDVDRRCCAGVVTVAKSRGSRHTRDTRRARCTRRARVTRRAINATQIDRVDHVGDAKRARDVLDAAHRHTARRGIVGRDDALEARLGKNSRIGRRKHNASLASAATRISNTTTATTRTRVVDGVAAHRVVAAVTTHTNRGAVDNCHTARSNGREIGARCTTTTERQRRARDVDALSDTAVGAKRIGRCAVAAHTTTATTNIDGAVLGVAEIVAITRASCVARSVRAWYRRTAHKGDWVRLTRVTMALATTTATSILRGCGIIVRVAATQTTTRDS